MASAGPAKPVPVVAGERATLDGAKVSAASPRPSVVAQRIAEAEADRPRAPLPPNLDAPALYAAHAELAKEADRLRGEVATLKASLEKATSPHRGSPYDVSPEDLRTMAGKCELTWDLPSLSPDKHGMGDKLAEKAGLSQEERAVVDKKFEESQRAMTDYIRKIYVETTGDATGGSLAPTAMLEEIEDKTSPEERQRVFQALSRERAELAPPPAPGTQESPYMRLYREMTSAGNTLETSIASELGPEAARRIRDANNGWGSVHRSSYGCPGQ